MLIYTDGSLRQGVGGWAWIEVKDGQIVRGRSGRTVDADSSNRMELIAVIQALISTEEGSEIEIRTDSQSVIRAYELGNVTYWQQYGWLTGKGKPVSNRDLWEVFAKLVEKRTVVFTWVKGHADDAYNQLCDILANADKFHDTLPITQEFPAAERLDDELIGTVSLGPLQTPLSPTIIYDPAFPDREPVVIPVGLPSQAVIAMSKEDHERLTTFIRAMSIADPTWKSIVNSLKNVVYV